MQNKITALTRDIQIHQDVEKELAKRSHYSQKIIKRMRDRIKDLEQRLQEKDHKPKLNLDRAEFMVDREIIASKYGITPNRNNQRNGMSMSMLESVGPFD